MTMKSKGATGFVIVTMIILLSAVTSSAQVVTPFGPVPEPAPFPPLPPPLPAPPAPPLFLSGVTPGAVEPITPFGPVSLFAGPADPETNLRQEILRVLIQNEPDRAIDIAADRLKADAGDPVVINNLNSIANSKSAKALPLILSIAKSSSNTNARRAAVNSLSRMSSVNLSTLEDLYKSSSDSVETRQAIVNAIGRSSDARTVTVLANIGKNDADVSVRRAAIQALSHHDGPDSTKALEDLLKSSPPRR
jgi:HEAT repeat protein